MQIIYKIKLIFFLSFKYQSLKRQSSWLFIITHYMHNNLIKARYIIAIANSVYTTEILNRGSRSY